MISKLFRLTLIKLLFALRPRAFSNQAVQLKACIFKVDRLGDFVLALGAIRAITTRYGESNCALVVFEQVAELARAEFPNAVVIPIAVEGGGLKQAFRLVRVFPRPLREYSFDTLICLRHQRTLTHKLVLSWISAKNRFGLANLEFGHKTADQSISCTLNIEIPKPELKEGNVCTELQKHASVLSAIFNTPVAAQDVLSSFHSITPVKGKGLLVTPFSSQTIKDYPIEKLIDVLKIFRKKETGSIVLCGGPAERLRLEELLRRIELEGIKDVSVLPQYSFIKFIQKVAEAHVLLTMDTSTAHVATALDKPTVIILGGGHYGMFGPWQRSNKQVWLTKEVPCFGCNWQCIHSRSLCITEIPPDNIASRILELFSACG